MRVSPAAVTIFSAFFREWPVSLPLYVEQFLPFDCVFYCYDFGESLPDLGEVFSCLGSWVECEMSVQIHADMEDAALDSGGGPFLSECGCDPGPAIADDHGRGGDARE